MVRARLAQLLCQILEAVLSLSLRMWQPPQQPQDDMGNQPQLQTLNSRGVLWVAYRVYKE